MKNKLIFLLSIIFILSISVVGTFPSLGAAAEIRRCALESCHGLNLKCGFNPPDMCTQLYSIGDFCRQYANCELSGETCKLVNSPTLDKCIACVNACPNKNPSTHADCEAKCRSKLKN